jgi:hypothetical protein
MIKPRSMTDPHSPIRPTIPAPKPDAAFDGWGPRLRF